MNVMEFRRGALASSNPAESRLGREGAEQRPPLLTQYVSIIRRRKWIIIGAVAGALLLGILITMLMTPQYTAETTIEIQRETRNFTMVEGAEHAERDSVDLEFYQTQYGLLKARSLADRVASDLRLYDNPDFFQMFGESRVLDEWFESGRVKPQASTREQRIRRAGDVLLRHLQVAPERLSRLVEIAFTSPDPAFSQQVVDAWGRHFVRATLERRFEATSYARQFLEERLAQLRTRIDESERLLVDYASRQGIVNLPAAPSATPGGSPGERSLIAEDLVAMNRELAEATADRVRAESRLGSRGDNVSEALQNQAITTLRARRADIAAEYARLLVQFEPDYPPARALQTQLAQIDRSIAAEENRVRSSLRETYSASRQREQELRGQVDQLKSGLLDLRRRSIQYNIYQREVDTNRELYSALLQRYKEIGVAGGVGVNNISVVDPAERPERPSSPRLLLNLLLALIAGAAIGGAAALALEQIDDGIADPGDVEGSLGIPLLGTVPKADSGEPVEALSDPKSVVSEAYLSLQTNLAFASDHGVPTTMAITSSRPSEGKSVTTFALAHFLARSNRKTLVLDADMRSPSVHHMFRMENRNGLSNYLAGDDDIDKLVRPTPIANLFVMTAGPQPPSAAELLSTDRVDRLLKALAEKFDHVVIDGPPVMGLADSPLIGSKVEGTIFVIEAHSTRKSVARVAIARLQAANAAIIGVVLTKFNVKRAHYGYGYDYGYGYGYGDNAKGSA